MITLILRLHAPLSRNIVVVNITSIKYSEIYKHIPPSPKSKQLYTYHSSGSKRPGLQVFAGWKRLWLLAEEGITGL